MTAMAVDLSRIFVRGFERADESVLKISQSEIGDVGCVVWDAAIVLASFLETGTFKTDICSDLRGSTVLELGAGTGIVGIQAASLGATCTITDLSDFVPLIDLNIKNNAELIHGSAEAQTLVWGEDITSFLPPVDLILFADCIYYAESLEPLVDTLDKLAGPQTVILCCYEERTTGNKPELQRKFFELIHQKFKVEEIPTKKQHPVYCSEDIHIHKLTKL